MLDSWLDTAVALLPIVLSIAGVVVSITAPKSHHKKWWYAGLVACGISLSALTFWQQHRSRVAHESEIRSHNAEVSQLRKDIARIPEQTVGLLASPRDAQIGGKRLGQYRIKPVTPKETAQAPPRTEPQPPLFADLRIASQAPDISTNPEAPYALKAVVQTNIAIPSPAFEFECNGNIVAGNVWQGSGPQLYIKHYFGIPPSNRHVYVAAWESPTFVPEQPLTVMIYSKQPLSLIAVRKITYQWPF